MDNVPVTTGGNVSPEEAAAHSVDWWLMGEDLPDPNNQVHLKGDKIHIDYTENKATSAKRETRGQAIILAEELRC